MDRRAVTSAARILVARPLHVTSTRRFFLRSRNERVAILEASACLAVARAALLAVPFRHLAAWLSRARQTHVAENVDHAAARAIARALDTAARYVPWDSRCLAQSLAATAMLRRRRLPSTTCLGVARGEPGTLRSHAWTLCGEVVVAGGDDAPERYRAIATFGGGG